MRIPILALLFCTSAVCQETPSDLPELASEMDLLKGFIGTWEVNATWENGTDLWARNEYSIGLNGKFIDATTYAKDGDGEPYERYRTIFSWDAKREVFVTHGFTFDGTVSVVDLKTSRTDDGQPIVESTWSPNGGPVTIRQRLQILDDDSFAWKVWSRAEDGGDWSSLINGTWKRVKKQ